jgi:hypothetical protein
MLTVHHALAFLVITVCLLATVLALVAYRTRGGAGLLVSQTLIVAQAAVGLSLLAGHQRANKGAHYMYGSLAVLAVAWPWLYAPPDPRRRLAWFAGATLLAAVLAVRAYMTA